MKRIYRVKIVRADREAQQKGFRAGQVHTVVSQETVAHANPKRGPLVFLCNASQGVFEGFFADQIRNKPCHRRE